MREYLFCGKRLDNGAWETGSLVIVRMGCHDEQCFIADKMTGYHTPIDPSTIGQYAGIPDKNGKKIFEGHILNIGGHIPTVNGRYLVIYDTVSHCWALKRSEEHHHHYFAFSDLNGFAEDSEVIGNSHDNPELLEV